MSFIFKPGDQVRCIDDVNQIKDVLVKGKIYTVKESAYYHGNRTHEIVFLEDTDDYYLVERFKKAEITDGPEQDKKFLRYRKIRVEDRK